MRVQVTDRVGNIREVDAAPGRKMMEILRDGDFDVAAICGGLCACATCHVYVDPDWAVQLPPASREESELLQELDNYDPLRSRLSCQLETSLQLSGIALTVAPE